MKFRKKPVVVEAIRFDRENEKECGLGMMNGYVGLSMKDAFIWVAVGDWIITEATGERSVCNPEIFEATYEKVEE